MNEMSFGPRRVCARFWMSPAPARPFDNDTYKHFCLISPLRDKISKMRKKQFVAKKAIYKHEKSADIQYLSEGLDVKSGIYHKVLNLQND